MQIFLSDLDYIRLPPYNRPMFYPRKPTSTGCILMKILVLALLFYAQSAVAQSGFEALFATLKHIAADSPGNSKSGVTVVDVASGTVIYDRNGDEPFNPASNTKIITAACALKQLGPEYRYVTSLHGRTDGAVIRGPVYLKGHGDPFLSTADLWTMARNLAFSGIRRIEGGIVVDDTYFDEENLPYAFADQPNEDAAFRAPVGAASLNFNALAISIRPGHQAMASARIQLEPEGYAVLDNDTITTAEGSHNPKISATSLENRTKIRVWGNVPLGSRPVTYYRRIDNPSLFSGYGLKSVLESLGVTVGGGVHTGRLPSNVPKLTEHESPPLSVILYKSGKESNNFVTETVLKTMGAEDETDPGTWQSALKSAKSVLTAWGIDPKTYVYRNGSGLFDANRFSSRLFTNVLVAVYRDASIRPEFLAQLATGGVDGTIASRYQGDETKRRVRAKTGTLADVSTLTGYVFDTEGRRPIAFSILVNNAAGFISASRSFQERIVNAIAKFLD
jgi:serine-type D-Ala-D-Ala carboxypeptidase/endopeptidase (penicillin-binding protein 4)